MSYSGRRFVVIAAFSFALMDTCVIADDASVDERAIADRFATVLERNPRRGTAFDKVYGYHAEQGTLDELSQKYRDRAAGTGGSDASASWIIVGLIEFQRGDEEKARLAFSQAEDADPENFMAPYLLGQTLAATNQPIQAAEALERALLKKPAAADLLDAYQLLGRLHQRAQHNDKALEVWRRLEEQFPDDSRVLEQIATTLLEEDALDAALPRFERLAQSARDPQRRARFRIEVAEIKARLGRTAEAQVDFDKLLSQLNPDDWLFRDVRRRIETLYLKRDDRAGLIAHYEAWVARHPEDLDAVSRLARRLTELGRVRASQQLLERSLKRAPRNKDIRLAYINLLLRNEKHADAMLQYAEMDKFDPGNPDILRDWGRAILSDPSVEFAERQQQAAAVWRRLLLKNPNDAAATAQVAELFRQARMDEDAIATYRRAIELAPDAVQYREYLGEYQMKLRRTAEALATWREMATGSRHTAANLSRLSELLSRSEQYPEAIDAIRRACELAPRDFTIQGKYADLLLRTNQLEEAVSQLAVLEKLAETDDERELWLERDLRVLKETNRLATKITDVRQKLESNPSGEPRQDAAAWLWLAKACEADGQIPAAVHSAGRAAALQPNSIPILTVAARVNELHQNLKVAVELNTRLATLNRRSRLEYLKRIATLEEALGHTDLALQAARELLSASPANPEVSETVAQLCFRLNRPDEGTQILRRALRTNPDAFGIVTRLATALRAANKTTEAIEVLWGAFERLTSLQERLQVVTQLTELHQQRDDLRTVYLRLERDRRDPAQSRELTICLARAHEVAGDLATAQLKLEALLSAEPSDAEILLQLRSLADRQRDPQSAIRFQRLIWKMTGSPSDRVRLAEQLSLAGDSEEAFRLLADTDDGKLTPTLLNLLDGLLAQRSADGALRLESLSRQFPNNWELLHRRGMFLARSSPQQAVASFESLIRLQRPLDEKSSTARATSHDWGTRVAANLPVVSSMEALNFAQEKVLAGDQWWTPDNYRQSRMVAIVMLVELEKSSGVTSEVVAELLNPPANRQEFVDQIVLFRRTPELEKQVAVAREFMRHSPDDLDAKVLFLQSVFRRWQGQGRTVRGNQPLAPLGPDPLQEVLTAYRAIAGNPELAPYSTLMLKDVVQELVLAHRRPDAVQLFDDAIASATMSEELGLLFLIRNRLGESTPDAASDAEDVSRLGRLLEKSTEITQRERATGTAGQSMRLRALANLVSPQKMRDQLIPVIQRCQPGEVLQIWSQYVRLLESHTTQMPASAVAVPLASTQSALPPGSQPRGRQLILSSAGPVAGFPGLVLKADSLQVLETIRHRFEVDGRKDELISFFRQHSELMPRPVAERLFWRHSLAYLQFSWNETDQAFRMLEIASEENPGRLDLQMGLVQQYQKMNLRAQALATLDKIIEIAGIDSSTERMALTLALESQDAERAQIAVDRLMGCNLAVDELSAVSRQLEGGGFEAQAEVLLTRTAETRALHASELSILMSAQMKLGKTAEATVTAKRGLELTSLRSLSRQSNLQPTREQYLTILSRTGALLPMIEKAERQLEKSPHDSSVISELIEMHGASNNRKRIDELELQQLNLAVTDPDKRCQLAMKYVQLEQPENALEQMRILMVQEPHLFALSVRRGLAPTNPLRARLAPLLADLDWGQSEKHVALMPNIIEQLRSVAASRHVGEKIFLNAWQNHPEFHMELLHKFNDDFWWRLPEVRRNWTVSLILGSDQEIKHQWKHFGRSLRYNDKEGLVTVWNRLLTECAADQSLDTFRESVARGIRQRPDWQAGPVMLGMIELRRGRLDAGQELLEKLFSSLPEEIAQDPMVAWEIALELVRHEQTLDLGARFYDIPITRYGATSASAETLLNAYLKFDRNAEARKMLLGFIPVSVTSRPESTIPAKADVSEAIAIGKRLHRLGYPLDALDLLLAVQPYAAGLHEDVNSSLAAIFGALQPAMFVDHLERLDGKSHPFRMQLYLRESGQSAAKLQSRWGLALADVASDPALRERARIAIRLLAEVQANPLDLHVASAHLSLSAGEDPKAVAEILVKHLDAHPLQVRVANPNRLTEAGVNSQATVWLVARECLKHPESYEPGEKLGTAILDFTLRDRTPATTISILAEWTQIALQLGRVEAVEQLLKVYDPIELKLAILSEWSVYALKHDDTVTFERVTREIEAIRNAKP